ncbi:MAG TPA: hypothetical protein VGM51_16700 [Armatimonadota bacterium]|jgi:hypothetical protein
MLRKFRPAIVAGLAYCLAAPPSGAQVIDPQGDWYSPNVATHRPDLDVRTADGIYADGAGWRVTATMDGPIDPTQQAAYVWGFGRGSTAAVAPFPGEPNVKFDSVLSYNTHDGTASVRLFDTSVVNVLTPDLFGFSGSTVTAIIPSAFLPTVPGGFDDDEFTWNLWPRIPGGPATNISDFAPDNAMVKFITVPAGAIPEPGTMALLASAVPLALLGSIRRRA